jgi:hypothetical protein
MTTVHPLLDLGRIQPRAASDVVLEAASRKAAKLGVDGGCQGELVGVSWCWVVNVQRDRW